MLTSRTRPPLGELVLEGERGACRRHNKMIAPGDGMGAASGRSDVSQVRASRHPVRTIGCTMQCAKMHCVGSVDDGQVVADEVRRRRQQRGWTLDEAAGRLGVSRRLLVQLEAGQANPSLSTLLSVAAGFDISLVELLAGGDKPSITLQTDNASAPVLWSGAHGGEARLLVGSDPLELWQWTLAAGDERTSDAHRSGSRRGDAGDGRVGDGDGRVGRSGRGAPWAVGVVPRRRAALVSQRRQGAGGVRARRPRSQQPVGRQRVAPRASSSRSSSRRRSGGGVA